MKLHIHFNNEKQTCVLESELQVGESVITHFHDAPDECLICLNGHCHAPNITLSRISEDEMFLAFENFLGDELISDIKTEIVNLPQHSTNHSS